MWVGGIRFLFYRQIIEILHVLDLRTWGFRVQDCIEIKVGHVFAGLGKRSQLR